MEQAELQAETNGLVAEIINRIADDPAFKDALLADAPGALGASGYHDRIDALVDRIESESEVAGFGFDLGPIATIGRVDLKNTTILASGAPSTGPSCGQSSCCSKPSKLR